MMRRRLVSSHGRSDRAAAAVAEPLRQMVDALAVVGARWAALSAHLVTLEAAAAAAECPVCRELGGMAADVSACVEELSAATARLDEAARRWQ